MPFRSWRKRGRTREESTRAQPHSIDTPLVRSYQFVRYLRNLASFYLPLRCLWQARAVIPTGVRKTVAKWLWCGRPSA
jgi:hypothetical protein